jgi:hypothetical protein
MRCSALSGGVGISCMVSYFMQNWLAVMGLEDRRCYYCQKFRDMVKLRLLVPFKFLSSIQGYLFGKILTNMEYATR